MHNKLGQKGLQMVEALGITSEGREYKLGKGLKIGALYEIIKTNTHVCPKS